MQKAQGMAKDLKQSLQSAAERAEKRKYSGRAHAEILDGAGAGRSFGRLEAKAPASG
jgi:hypothetical protein